MSATRLVNGSELPVAGSWELDPGHTEVGFVGRHFGLTKVRGRFTGVSGSVIIGAEPVDSSIEVVIVNGDPNPNRPDLPHYGAGETVCKPLIAAVANAIYDATGVRLRRVPFRDARVLAALKTAGV